MPEFSHTAEHSTLPPDVIAAQAEYVEWPPHRERLHGHLGRLTEQHTEVAAIPDYEELPHYRTDIYAQSELIAEYYSQASERAGPEADEDLVWEVAFETQLTDIAFSESAEEIGEIAVNMLVGNLMATYDMDDASAETVIRDRMWSIAYGHIGADVMRAAQDNLGICVMTGDDQKPYESIVEQTQPYGVLLLTTDKDTDKAAIEMPFHRLEMATPEQQAWFVSEMGKHGNLANIERNAPFIQNKQAVLDHLLQYGTIPPGLLTGTSFKELMTPAQAANIVYDTGYSALYRINFSDLTQSEQSALYERVYKDMPHEIPVWLEIGFTNLPGEKLKDLVGGELPMNGYLTNLQAFHDIPPGVLEKLQTLHVSNQEICDALHNFPLQDRKKYYEHLISTGNAVFVVENPDKFDFVDTHDLYELAKKETGLHVIAANITKYTSGDDKDLIERSIKNGDATLIVRQLDDLPDIDADWLAKKLTTLGYSEYAAYCLPYAEGLDQQEVFDALIRTGEFRGMQILSDTLQYFTELDQAELLKDLVNGGFFSMVASNRQMFSDIPDNEILSQVGRNADAVEIMARNLDVFPDADKIALMTVLAVFNKAHAANTVALAAIEAGTDPEELWQLAEDSDRFLVIFIQNRNVADKIGYDRLVARRMDACFAPYEVTQFLATTNAPEVHRAYLNKALQTGHLDFIFDDRLKVSDEDKLYACLDKGLSRAFFSEKGVGFIRSLDPALLPTQEDLMQRGDVNLLLAFPDLYPSADRDELFGQLTAKDDMTELMNLLHSSAAFKAPKAVAERLLESDIPVVLHYVYERFEPAVFDETFMLRLVKSGSVLYDDIYKYSGQKHVWMERSKALFGQDPDGELVAAVQEVLQNTGDPLPPELQELGITTRGEAGFEAMQQANRNIQAKLLTDPLTQDEREAFVRTVTENPVARAIAMRMVRFKDAEYGDHSTDEWEDILRGYEIRAPNIRPLPEAFVPSEEFTIHNIDAVAFNPANLNKDAVERYGAFAENINRAVELARSPDSGRYSGLFNEAKSLLEDEQARLTAAREILVAQQKTKAVAKLDERMAAVDRVKDMGALQFMRMSRDGFELLADLKVKGMDNVIRTGTFIRAIRHSQNTRRIADSLYGKPPSFDSITAMNNFVDHIINNETYGDYFATKTARNAFMRITDTAALQNQIAKAQAAGTTGVSTLQFIPTRGALLELSGHVGDACWASNYESIGEQFPHFSAVSMLRDRGKATERLVGSMLLIETKDLQTGEDVLVLRGINPIQRYISKVKVKEFFTAVETYAKSIAGNRKVAVVIDDHCGGATTNRPELYEYIAMTVKDTKTNRRSIILPDDTTFNGYKLSIGQSPAYYLE